MNWRSETIEDLKTHRARESALYSISEKINAIRYDKNSIKAVTCDKVPVQGGMSKAEEKLLNLLAEEEALIFTYQATKIRVDRINQGLDRLTTDECKVLDYFYINPVKNHVEKLMAELGYERTHVYRVKDKTVRKLAALLYSLIEY